MALDVGLNRLSPVDWDLGQRKGTYRYTGRINKVTITPGPLAPGQGPELRERLHQLAMALQ